MAGASKDDVRHVGLDRIQILHAHISKRLDVWKDLSEDLDSFFTLSAALRILAAGELVGDVRVGDQKGN